MHIPGASSSSAQKRHAQFVASSTEGVLVTVYASSDTGHTNPLASSATNVSSGSTACGGTVGARTCAIVIPAPPGSDAFVFQTYDQPPIAGTITFPSGANLLATGVVPSQTITAGQANVVNVTLSGTLASFLINPFQTVLIGGVSGQTASISITGFDAGGNAIIGSYTDVNGNPDPIALSVQETGGSGFTTIAVDGATPSETGSVTQSSDTIVIHYDGGGSPGYYATIATVPANGPPAQNPTFDPLFLSAVPPSALTIAATPAITLQSGQSVTVNYSVQNEGSITPNLGGGSCPGIVSIGSPTPATGGVGSFTITDAAGGNCVASMFFGGTTNLSVDISAAGSASATVAVPGTTLAYLPLGTGGVAIENEAGAVLGTVATNAGAVALDDAGNLYTLQYPPSGNTGPGVIRLFTPGGSTYPPAYTASTRTYAPSDPDYLLNIQAAGNGELVGLSFDFATNTTVVDMWSPGASGAPTHTVTYASPSGSAPVVFGGIDHAGNIYVTYYNACTGNASLTCVFYDVLNASGTVVRTIPESIVPQANQSAFVPNYFATDASGTLYVTEWTYVSPDPNAGLYIYPVSGPETFVSNGAFAPNGIDLDAAGNIYVVNDNTVYDTGTASLDNAHVVSVLSPGGGTVLRNVDVPVEPYPITVAGDGTAFVSSLGFAGATPSTYVIPAAQFTTQQINTAGASDVVLWDGTRTTLSRARAPQSLGRGAAHGSSGFAALNRLRRR